MSSYNQKGGVGKSTTSFAFASSLSNVGNRVLLVDLDPQASLTLLTGNHNPDAIQHTISNYMLHTFQDRADCHSDIAKHIGQNLDLIPSNIQLSGIETMLVNAMSRENILRASISQVKHLYDYVIIDCMPSLGMLT